MIRLYPIAILFPYTTLFRSIESIINQKYPFFHLVIVIDGVTPNVDSIAQEYASKDSRITVISREDNRGTDVALNIGLDRKSTRLNSSHVAISYAVFCFKKKN